MDHAHIAQHCFGHRPHSGIGAGVGEALRQDHVDLVAGQDQAGGALRRIDRDRYGAGAGLDGRGEKLTFVGPDHLGHDQRFASGEFAPHDGADKFRFRNLAAHQIARANVLGSDFLPADVLGAQQGAAGDHARRDENGLPNQFRPFGGRTSRLAQPDNGKRQSRKQREDAYSEQEIADKH